MNRGFRGRRGTFRGGSRGTSWRERGGNNHARFVQTMRNSNRNKNAQFTPNSPGTRLNEEDIGVTQYISDHEGFSAIIKNRFADFQVSEISESGEVAKLTSIKAPVQEKEVVDEDEDFLLSKYNLEILPMETWDRINTLATKDTTDVVEVDVTGMSKEHRTKIHDAVNMAFGEAIVGSTITKDDRKLVKFIKYRVGARIDKRVKWMWPSDYVQFVVYKENCDTIEAAALIASRLNTSYVKPSMIGYAGTKDRRAKTSQWFSIRRVEPSKIEKACCDLKDVSAGNYKFSDTPLKLGCLKGNRFRIALRNVLAEDEVVNKACEQLRDKGFINYYGLQRFGTRHSIPTYTIGRHLLQGHFQEAINLILEVHDGPLFQALLTYSKTRDASAALKHMRKCDYNTIEGRLLKALAAAPNDLYGAMSAVARNVRLLYLHSYQSITWNRCVSERLRRHTCKPVPGDIVLINENDYKPENEEEQELSEGEDVVETTDPQKTIPMDTSVKTKLGDEAECESKNSTHTASETSIIIDTEMKTESENSTKPESKNSITESDDLMKIESENSKDMESENSIKTESETVVKSETENTVKMEVPPESPKAKEKIQEKKSYKIPVKILTEADIATGQYTMSDIVMPLPGFDMEYPPNMIDYYEELLSKDNLKLTLRHKHKSYSLSGAYRHVVARPFEMEWQCVKYTDPYGDLIASDMDELLNKEISCIIPDGKYKALLLTLSLPPSCYATMALREIMKANTSGDYQASLNNYFKDDPEFCDVETEKRKRVEEDNSVYKRMKEDGVTSDML